jgi:hypothetical protein
VLAYKPTTSQQYPVGCRAVEPSRSEEQRRFCLFPLQTRALNKQVTNYNRAKINKTLRSEMEEGGQPVVIGGSDSAELDKLQLQRDRALHQIQRFAFNSDLRADREWALVSKSTERNGRFERLNSACCLFVCKGKAT